MSSHAIDHHIARLKESFLCAAARGGRLSECAGLLDLGAALEWRDGPRADTPLLAAVRHGHREVAALLLAYGADPAARDGAGNTSVHVLAAAGDEGLASLFSPNASALALRTNDDGMTAIDIAVQKGFNSFAEHLNNLLYASVGERGDTGEEKDGPVTSPTAPDALSVGGSSRDSENDCDEGHRSHEVSFTTPLGESDTSTSAAAESGADEGMLRVHASDADGEHECFAPAADAERTNDHALIGQLRQMTHLAREQSKELYQAKCVVSELMKAAEEKEEALRHVERELAVYRGGDDARLAHRSLAELVALEEEARRALERIVTAKEVASSNLQEERVCVICRENPKCVLLMNCRHLCVCKECGHHEALVQCPLCRETITERINVFA